MPCRICLGRLETENNNSHPCKESEECLQAVENDRETLGHLLKRVRMARGVSISQMASVLGFSYNYITNVENSLSSGEKIKWRTMYKWITFLCIPMAQALSTREVVTSRYRI